MTMLRIARLVPRTEVEGPGLRYALWVQGCPIRCEGCFNPHTWDMEGGRLIEVEELIQDIEHTRRHTPELEGVTFLGGEPFSQAGALAEAAEKVRGQGLSVVTFSGYDYDTLRASSHPGWKRLLAATDLLIDGPYVKERHDLSRPWTGSSNQQYRFLTAVYRHLEPSLQTIPNKLEIRLHPDGTITANGMAGALDLEMLERLGYTREEG